jgi:L-2-amino-thiazoline-4-carboxylic acid hydrolase
MGSMYSYGFDRPASRLVERKEFLIDIAKVAGGIICMGGIAGLLGCAEELTKPAVKNPAGEPASYTRVTLVKQFEEMLPFYRQTIEKAMGAETRAKVVREAMADYHKTMFAVPYIGQAKYPLPETLIQSGVALSFYRALRSSGTSEEKAGKIIFDAGAASIRSAPESEMKATGAYQFTQQWYDMQKMLAAKSHEKHYPGDWVYSFVEGVPGEFDWGWDFTECGTVKLYKPNGNMSLVPQLCNLDFVASECEGTGLRRTTTLATGGSKCDFRYKQGRAPA